MLMFMQLSIFSHREIHVLVSMAGTGELFMLFANYCCIAYATNDNTCLHVQMVLHIVRLAFPFALGFPLFQVIR